MRLLTPLRGLDDRELVALVLDGDRAAPTLLFDRHAPHVTRVLRRMLGATGDHADLVSEVFVRAIDRLHRLERLDDPRSLERWLTRIAVFAARERLRSERRRRWLVLFSSSDVPDLDADSWAGAGPSQLDELEARDSVRRLFVVLDKFPIDERLVFTLRYLEEMELADVASACGVSLATCKRRLARADARFVPLARRDPVLRALLERGTRWSPA
jgi:RNA polymerase sigma-70 factor (ECF subfamily)